MTRALVTGFEPFGGATVNPSALLVAALAAEPPAGVELATAVLPVSYARAAAALREAVRASAPDVVVCFGQADGRPGLAVERFALNADEPSNVDAEGASSGAAVDPDGPLAYASGLPVDEIVAALRAEGIPAAPSRDAGGFLCNHVFYALMRLLAAERPGARGGFVHVPLLPEQALEPAAPSMPLEMLVRAARIAVAVAAR
ncbi:MAG: pyroglutamyl-peptidase I [Gaiellaceae bacterium]